jgi:hypothetical protein
MSYRPVAGRKASSLESELWILNFLLEQPNHESPNALYTEADATKVLSLLLQHGYGRRDGIRRGQCSGVIRHRL